MEPNEQSRRWLDTAVAGIRFFVDRDAVRKELAAHLEDKAEDFRRIFPEMPPEEAEERALSEMGDPEELRESLAQIHRPWLGRLWMASKVLVWVMVLAALWVNIIRDHYNYTGTGTELWDWSETLAGTPAGASTLGRSWQEIFRCKKDPDLLFSRTYRGEEDLDINGHTVSLRRAALWQGEDGLELYLYLRNSTLLFWERGYLDFDGLQVTDSRGGVYAEFQWNMIDPPNSPDSIAGARLWDREYDYRIGPFFRSEAMMVRNVDPEAEWVRLDFGPFCSFTVSLEGS